MSLLGLLHRKPTLISREVPFLVFERRLDHDDFMNMLRTVMALKKHIGITCDKGVSSYVIGSTTLPWPSYMWQKLHKQVTDIDVVVAPHSTYASLGEAVQDALKHICVERLQECDLERQMLYFDGGLPVHVKVKNQPYISLVYQERMSAAPFCVIPDVCWG